MVQSLMHKFIVTDATKCFPSMPDYMLIFKRRGESETPVTHVEGLIEYAGESPVLPFMAKAYNNVNNTDFTADQLWKYLNDTRVSGKISKLNHYIWQRYASSVWDDIRNDNTLPFREAKEEDDERHVHPLQLDVIERCIDLWTNPCEIVLTPFMGVGSEVYSAVKKGRKGIGIELKESYYKQAILNLKEAEQMRARDYAEQECIF